MIPVDEALDRIFAHIPPPGEENVPLLRAHRRVLARPLVAVPVEDGANLMLGPYAFRFHTIAGLIAHLERMNRVRQG